MTNYWKNSSFSFRSIKLHEDEFLFIEDNEYYEKVLRSFPKHHYCNLSSIDDVKNFIITLDNWHDKLESDLEAIVFTNLIEVGLNPLVNPQLKDIINEEKLENPLSEQQEKYRLDQVLYINQHPILWLEIDGKQHEDLIIPDAERESVITKILPRTYLLRISAKEIRKDIKSIAQMVKRTFHYVAKRHLITEQYINELSILDLDYEGVLGELEVRSAIYKRDEDLAQWLRDLDC
ncbi:hypothetical protein [Peribacillus simplex]|uniref:hypothetical protein n=1 Tax=Peribacillus simplex TaxID=1478 RepID=UPI003CFD7C7F